VRAAAAPCAAAAVEPAAAAAVASGARSGERGGAAAVVGGGDDAEARRAWGNFGLRLQLSAAALLRCDLQSNISHSFSDESAASPARYSVLSTWALHFHALRELYADSARSFALSLASSQPWAVSGGKSGASFERSADRRMVTKHVSRTEWDMFNDYIAPAYFAHMHDCLVAGTPCLLVKTLGCYKVTVQVLAPAAPAAAAASRRLAVVVAPPAETASAAPRSVRRFLRGAAPDSSAASAPMRCCGCSCSPAPAPTDSPGRSGRSASATSPLVLRSALVLTRLVAAARRLTSNTASRCERLGFLRTRRVF
jgi:hypothetical protein